MNDTLYHYIDPGFSHTAVGSYTLLLQLNPASFTLAVMQGSKLMVWRRAAPLAEFTRPGEVQEVLGFAYQNVITGIASNQFTLIPNELFKQDDITHIARYLDVLPADNVFSQPFDNANQIIFKVNELLTIAAGRFDLQQVVFGAAGWVHALAAANPTNEHLYLNLNEGTFDVAYFRQGKLYLYNTFEFTHEDEVAYYTVFVCQQLKLEMGAVDIILSGNLAADDNRYHTILSDFFKSVTLHNAPVAQIPDHLPKHQLLALTALPLCASLADA
jgi:hypothetical protein